MRRALDADAPWALRGASRAADAPRTPTLALVLGALALLAAGALGGPARAAERTLPIDCLPEALVANEAVDPAARFGYLNLPGIVLGPPGPSPTNQGSTTVAALGIGGAMRFAFEDVVVEDRPGPDFIVFENAFFQGAAPETQDDPWFVFHEPAYVEVSADGVEWRRFPVDEAALAEAGALQTIDRALFLRLGGLAGVTPSFTGDWTTPDVREEWDPEGVGGVSGAGGDAFDLAELGLAEARYVRVVDAGYGNGFAGAAEGFDLDAIVALNARPAGVPAEGGGPGAQGGSAAPDADGDGLSDLEEERLYGTNPALADSDGDGLDDGRELAGCRDPLVAQAAGEAGAPHLVRTPRLWLTSDACTELRWTWLAPGDAHDVLRGELDWLVGAGDGADLGPATCLAAAWTGVRYACDAETPLPGEGFYYLVERHESPSGLGMTSALGARTTSGGCAP